MRVFLVLAAFIAALAAGGLGSDAAPRARKAPQLQMQDFTSAEDILRWINGYRDEPQPARLPMAVQAMSRLGLLRDMDGAGVYVGFTAGVLGDNQLEAERLVAGMFPLPPEEQALVIKAIAYSGLPDRLTLLQGVAERMPARRALLEKYLSGKEPGLMQVPLDSGPAAVDTLWGFYFATGAYEPVQRMVQALAWAADKKDVNKLTIASMAKWTLAQNASRDKALLELIRVEAAHQTKEVAEPLKEVVSAAENFETAKIRKDALAAIEELKRKGPEKELSWTALGVQAAPTVVALGCVAASVTGNVEIGVPCILTGALSSAVAKIWSPSP